MCAGDTFPPGRGKILSGAARLADSDMFLSGSFGLSSIPPTCVVVTSIIPIIASYYVVASVLCYTLVLQALSPLEVVSMPMRPNRCGSAEKQLSLLLSLPSSLSPSPSPMQCVVVATYNGNR